ncbi:MAG: acyl carrier protein [Eubacterium sp.]|nr:acyl carrier protein [Eubacterium sp.]
MDKAMEFKKMIAQYSNVKAEDMTDEMSVRDDLGLSSLDFMTFLGELEDTFDIEIDLDEAVNINTVGEAITMMNELVAA